MVLNYEWWCKVPYFIHTEDDTTENNNGAKTYYRTVPGAILRAYFLNLSQGSVYSYRSPKARDSAAVMEYLTRTSYEAQSFLLRVRSLKRKSVSIAFHGSLLLWR